MNICVESLPCIRMQLNIHGITSHIMPHNVLFSKVQCAQLLVVWPRATPNCGHKHHLRTGHLAWSLQEKRTGYVQTIRNVCNHCSLVGVAKQQLQLLECKFICACYGIIMPNKFKPWPGLPPFPNHVGSQPARVICDPAPQP